jgi:hypothetical protein
MPLLKSLAFAAIPKVVNDPVLTRRAQLVARLDPDEPGLTERAGRLEVRPEPVQNVPVCRLDRAVRPHQGVRHIDMPATPRRVWLIRANRPPFFEREPRHEVARRVPWLKSRGTH